MKYVLPIVMVLLLNGCCALSKRSCFPTCPLPTVSVVGECKFPEKITLPKAYPTIEGCPDNYVCFDETNYKSLITRENMLKQWISEAIQKNKKVQ